MKIKGIVILSMVFVFSQNTVVLGQDTDVDWDLLLIREDQVFPSMAEDYQMSLTDLKDLLTEKKEKNFNYFTHLQDDYMFTHITPIKHFKDLGNGMRSLFGKEANDTELDLVLDYMDQSIESYRNYVVQYRSDLSYIPEGDDWGDNTPYRKWSYYYCQPGTEGDVELVLSSWKNLYQDKGVEMGFRVFKGFIGIGQPVYILTTWGEDPMSYQVNLQKVSLELGEKGAGLLDEMIGYVNEIDIVEGWYLPQYSYTGGKKLAE